MPVDRAVLVEIVGYVQADVLPFAQSDQRPRHGAIHREGMARTATGHEMRIPYREIDVLTGKLAKALLRVG